MDDDVDPDLVELLRQRLGMASQQSDEVSGDTGVLKDAKHIYDNAVDVSIDMYGTKGAAASIYTAMQQQAYSTDSWAQHPLHPKQSEGFSDLDIVNFIFTMDLLNFSFWSELDAEERYQVEYRGQRWTGYNSLVACLRRALDGNVPITTPRFWTTPKCSRETMEMVFYSVTNERIPLMDARMAILREAGDVLHEIFGDSDDHIDAKEISSDKEVETDAAAEAHANGEDLATDLPESESKEDGVTNEEATQVKEDQTDQAPSESSPEAAKPASEVQPDYTVVRLIETADRSAGKLVNLLAKHFECFRDETRFDGKKVRLLKRAQIFVADLWAAFGGKGYGEFHDIDHITMFADYRVPQMLHSLNVLTYSPPLDNRVRRWEPLESGHSWEIQLRGCSIWAVEMIRREIEREHPEAGMNAVLIDFFLYDLAKEKERMAGGLAMPHHRTRSIWY
ncbi:hypothetical protein KC336_g14261 [Hortaea werneckii]|nr:hypothetical protein KC336_g14261 [Hortaea werneckii]